MDLDAESVGRPGSPERGAFEEPRDDLQRLRAELERRDEFLAVLAHELRNSLSPVALTIDFLARRLRAGHMPPGQLLLQQVELCHGHLRRLRAELDELLDISRISTGRLDLRLESVDLDKLVSETLAEMQPQLEASVCSLRYRQSGSTRGVWDPLRLKQVIRNLLSNALKFGSGAPVEVELSGEGDEVRLAVSDRGPGIAEADRERIFERFLRTRADRGLPGFGVGLWLIRRIVEALGGEVTLESTPGVGSTFVVTLPKEIRGEH